MSIARVILAGVAITAITSPVLAAQNAAIERLAESLAIAPESETFTLSGKVSHGYYRAYACPSFAAAQGVIAAIPRSDDRKGTPARQTAAMRAALRRLHCTPAKGTFRPLELGREVWINIGYEAEESWVAVAVSNVSGAKLGLVIDSSPYAPVQ